MNKNHSLLIFSAALVTSALIVGGSLVYFAQKKSPAALGGSDSMTITDEEGNVYSIDKQEPVKLTVISDSNCVTCDSEKIETWLRSQLGVPLAVRRLEFTYPEAENLLKNDQATLLPYLLLDKEIEKLTNFTHLTHHVITASKEGYYVDFKKMGATVGRYLNVAYYDKDDPEAPKITAETMEFDFGEVKLSGGKVSTEFVVKNEGESPLEFLNANTSCGCTSTQIVLEGSSSPIYMMAGHQEPVSWRGTLAPGAEATIIVYYDPTVHPDLSGAVTREVMIDTNDPNTPQLKLKIHANQNPS